MYIICACMPAIRNLFSKMLPSLFGGSVAEASYLKSSNYNTGSNFSSNARYLRQRDDHNRANGIMKSVDVDLYHTERSASDVELVDANGPHKIYGA